MIGVLLFTCGCDQDKSINFLYAGKYCKGSMEERDCVGLEKCGVSSSDLQSKDHQMKILVSELVQSQFFLPRLSCSYY